MSYELFASVAQAVVYSLASLVAIVEPMRRDLWSYNDGICSTLTRSPLVFGTLWCVALPAAITFSHAPDDYLSDNVTFLYIKLWSVALGCSSFLFFNYGMPRFKSRHELRIRNVTIATILSVNILEASVKQLFFHDNRDSLDYINGVCGLILAVTTYLDTYKIPILTEKRGSITELKCQMKNSYILAYTFWNILFVSKVAPEISFLMFFMVSHMVGIVAHFTNYGDWLQTRAATLLCYICIKFGVTPTLRFFPEFFDPTLNNSNNPLIKGITSNYYLYPLVSIVGLCTIWNIIDTVYIYKKSERIVSVLDNDTDTDNDMRNGAIVPINI